MFGGEKSGAGEEAELGREQARQVGENVQNAVNNGERMGFGKSGGDFRYF